MAQPSSSSVSRRYLSDPDARNRVVPELSNSRTVAMSRPLCGAVVGERRQQLGLIRVAESVDQLVEVTVHESRQAVQVEPDAVVGQSILREIVGTDLLGTLART